MVLETRIVNKLSGGYSPILYHYETRVVNGIYHATGSGCLIIKRFAVVLDPAPTPCKEKARKLT